MSCPVHSPLEHDGLQAATKAHGRDRAWKQFEARRQPFYGPMARKAKQARDEIAAVAIRQVESTRLPSLAVESVNRTLSRVEHRTTIRDMVRDIFRTVGRRFATEAFNELKALEQKADPVDEWFQSVEEWLANEGGEEIRGILETTRQDITQILSNAREDGLGSEEMARRLEEEIDEVNRQRGRVIARTEVITASNKASHEGAKSTGLNLEKEWADSADSRVRDSHEIVDGQTKRIDEPFRWTSPESGQVEAMYPAQASLPAAERIQCRCVSLRSTVNEGVAASSTPTFGDTSEKEGQFHQRYSGSLTARAKEIIRKEDALDKVRVGPSGSYKHSTKTITLKDEKPELQKGTWVHEYGHHVDHYDGLRIRSFDDAAEEALEDYKNRWRRRADITSRREQGEEAAKSVREAIENVATDSDADDILRRVADDAGVPLEELREVSGGDRAVEAEVLGHLTEDSFDRAIRTLKEAQDLRSGADDELLRLADFLGALTRNKSGWGHSKSYYKKSIFSEGYIKKAQASEMWANYFEAKARSDSFDLRLTLMQKIAPRTFEKFEQIYGSL